MMPGLTKAPSASAEDKEPFLPTSSNSAPRARRRCWSASIIWAQLVTIVVLCALLAHDDFKLRRKAPRNGKEVYSPVNHLITYENVVFTGGFGTGRTEFQGPPSAERDALWEDLYSFGISRIPRSSAAQLVNKTVPIPNDNGHYVVSLNVFHHLHCLDQNMIRLRIWSTETYEPDDELMGIEHIEHCIDALRQSLMCCADVSPHPWVWWEKDREAKEVAEVAHTCRNFEGIRDWARANRIKHFDRTIHVHDSLD